MTLTRGLTNHAVMGKLIQTNAYYDRLFEAGGHGGVYDLPYHHSAYLPLYRGVLRQARRMQAQAVLEVGCGTGAFAHLLTDNTEISYAGFDFSNVAIEKAHRRVKQFFFVGDALDASSYTHPYDTIVCTEVLEHIENDLGVIDHWRPGANCICSVPNFDSESHVRLFRSEHEVRVRYGSAIVIDRITRIKKPALSDISWRNYLRALRWYRYRPRQLLALAAIGGFDSRGGWFVFSGRKR
jgi:SAM-dependent methyltransferase